MAAQKAAGMMAAGTRGQLIGRGFVGGSKTDPPIEEAKRWEEGGNWQTDFVAGGRALTLAEAGIDKHLADRARKAAKWRSGPHEDALRSWAKKLIQTKPFKLVAVALASKMARIAFAILRGKTTYSPSPA
jgi:hypothetical protein